MLWLGSVPDQVLDPKELIAPLAPYASLTDEHLTALRAARAADADHVLAALQRQMLDRIARS